MEVLYERHNRGFANVRSKDPIDECYTQKVLLDEVFPTFIDKIKDKKVLSPCDSDESQIVKWLSQYCKEYRYSCSDMFENEDIEWADIIITNPPFSKSKKFVDTVLNPLGKDWILFTALPSSGGIKYQARSWWAKLQVEYDTPDGKVRKVPTVICSSVENMLPYNSSSYTGENKTWDIYKVTDTTFGGRRVYPTLYSYGIKEIMVSPDHGGYGFKSMEPMVDGNYYMIPNSDIGFLPAGFSPLRSFDDIVLSCSLNIDEETDTGTNHRQSYERIIVASDKTLKENIQYPWKE